MLQTLCSTKTTLKYKEATQSFNSEIIITFLLSAVEVIMLELVSHQITVSITASPPCYMVPYAASPFLALGNSALCAGR